MEELRECPFCGKTPIIFKDGTIECSNNYCPVRPGLWPLEKNYFGIASDDVEEEQIASWNTRSSDATIKDLVEALEFVVDQLTRGGLGACECCKHAEAVLAKHKKQTP